MRVFSSTPGRVRFALPHWISGTDYPAAERKLKRLPGVKKAAINAVTGRALIEYDPEKLGLDDFERELAGNLPAVRVRPAPAGGRASEIRSLYVNLLASGVVLAFLVFRRTSGRRTALVRSRGVVNLASVTTLAAGYPIFRQGIRSLFRKQSDIDTLIGFASIASLLLRESITGLVVVWLVNLSSLFQVLTLRRSRRAIADLIDLGEGYAWRVTPGGEEERVPVDDLAGGDMVAVHVGEKIPVDGEITEGEATVNQSPVTGESFPVLRGPGDEVFAGTIIDYGLIKVRATRVGDETAIGRVIQMVEEARESCAPIQCTADRFASRVVPYSFALAAAVFLITRDIRRSMTMLVIACPCAASLSTPTAVSAAIGNAARRQVLVKGGRHLEAIGRMDTVVFDKTGTITRGRPRVTRIISLIEEMSARKVLELAGSVELHSSHPLALAVLKHAEEMEVEIPLHSDYEIIVGHGVRATVDGSRVLVGSGHMMADFRIGVPGPVRERVDGYLDAGENILFVAENDRLAGLIGIADRIRPEAAAVVARLRDRGFRRFMMITGDVEENARLIAGQVSIDDVHAEVFPEDKLEMIRELKRTGHNVIMVGDGINDAPALALADVGVAMGNGSPEAAIEAADVTLAANDLGDIVFVIDLSRHTIAVIRQNLSAAVGINVLGIALGAVGILSPVAAAVLHNMSTALVVLNSSRLLRYRPRMALPPVAASQLKPRSDAWAPAGLLPRPPSRRRGRARGR